MLATKTDPAHMPLHAPRPDPNTLTVLSFSNLEDHCRYDTDKILATFDAEQRTIVETCLAPSTEPVSSIELYCASEELEELGHDDLSETLGQSIHEENIFGCLCRNEAFTGFAIAVDRALDDIDNRFPHTTWWTSRRSYASGIDGETLFSDLGWDDDKNTADEISFALDEHGNGTLTSGDRQMSLVAFTTPELGAFAQRLDAGDILSDTGALYEDLIAEWLGTPPNVREVMASVHFHDVYLTGTPVTGKTTNVSPEVRGMDLSLEQMEEVARRVTTLAEPAPSAVLALLPGATGTLEDIITAVRVAITGTSAD